MTDRRREGRSQDAGCLAARTALFTATLLLGPASCSQTEPPSPVLDMATWRPSPSGRFFFVGICGVPQPCVGINRHDFLPAGSGVAEYLYTTRHPHRDCSAFAAAARQGGMTDG